MFLLCLILIVLGDAATKLLTISPAPSAIIKGLLLIPMVIYSFKIDRSFLFYFSISFSLFIFGCLMHSKIFMIQSIPQFFEYFFGIFFFITFKNTDWKKLYLPLNIIFLTHATIILIAVIFQISFLKTYYSPDRFGYISLFNSQNEFSFILMAGTIFFYSEYWIKRKSIVLVKLLVFAIAGLMVGTKAFLLFLLGFSIIVLFSTISLSRSLIISIVALIAVWLSKTIIIGFIKNHFGLLFKLYQKEGFLSVISSRRTIYLEERFTDYMSQNTVVNFLFGGGRMNQIFEMSLLDVLSFMGIIGFFLYIYLLYTRILKYLDFPTISKMLFGLVILISVFSGYLLENASAQLYILVVGMIVSVHFGSNGSANRKSEEKNIK